MPEPADALNTYVATFFGRKHTFKASADKGYVNEIKLFARSPYYPVLAFIPDVRTIFDVGASYGHVSLYFGSHYTQARIHAFEPQARTFAVLRENMAAHPNVTCHNLGLHEADDEAVLHHGRTPLAGSIKTSIFRGGTDERIRLAEAGAYAAGLGVERIDLLKIDTEGCELPILRSLSGYLPTVKAVYLEYHSEEDRLAIDALLAGRFILYSSRASQPHLGMCCYVARELLAATNREEFAFREDGD